MWLAAAVVVPVLVSGCTKSHGGHDAVGSTLLALLVALVAAKLGGEIFVRIGQPAVLGELVLGIAVGNIVLLGYHGLSFLETDHYIQMLAELGVILLLFQVGLESDIKETLNVGVPSLIVATLGVIAPIALGWGVAAILLPKAGVYVHAFIGATLCATSVGITARVLRDLGRTRTAEARIILGAAVIDDVMGLVILAIVQGAIAAAESSSSISVMSFVLVTSKAIAFLLAAPFVGYYLAPRVFQFVARFKADDLSLVTGLATCFGFAYVASLVGLAPIVGGFAAGLVLEEAHWRDFSRRGERSLGDLIAPIAGFLVPVFFFRMGTGVSLAKLAHPQALVLAAALTVAAVAGKQVCCLGVFRKGLDRLSIGIGMIPRGEVGLIFAGIGAKLTLHNQPVIEPAVFSALVIVITISTIVTPPLLKWSLSRSRKKGVAV